jgi:DNA-binding PucR family transcriptional regulator
MIVHRITVQYQVDKVEEAIALLKEEVTRAQFPHAVRLYRPRFGVTDMTIGEFAFANLDEMAQFWADWQKQPETQAFWQKYRLLIQPGAVYEILDPFLEIDRQ